MPKRGKEKKNPEDENDGMIDTTKWKKSTRDKSKVSQNVSEDFKVLIEQTIRTLQTSSDSYSHTFPSLSKAERKYIHKRCLSLGLKSKSHGKEPNRCIEIFVKKIHVSKTLTLDFNIKISNLMSDMLSVPYNTDKCNTFKKIKKPMFHLYSRLNSACQASIPNIKTNRLTYARQSLPIYERKAQFLHLLNTNQVLIISSETGSGKTTQIPQFILEQAHERNGYCKIICTQPRRISTISVAERVAAERGEEVGYTVGYQIKLETKAGPNSALVYCTNGVLLRTFMSRDKFFKTITHLILDEIHERDKSTDLLLISIRECLKCNPQLKLILMSATCEVQLFMSYFDNVQLLHVEGRNYEIREYFLEGIMQLLGYDQDSTDATGSIVESPTNDYDKNEMDNIINKIIQSKEEDNCTQLLQLILSENADVNHGTSDGGLTPLMAAAVSGNVELANVLLNMGADVSLKSTFLKQTAAEWAVQCNNNEVYNMIMSYMPTLQKSDQMYSEADFQELPLVDNSNSNNFMKINYNLIIRLILFIRNSDRQSTILIFFPGYEDIVTCSHKILESPLDENELKIIFLHSSISSHIRKSVFETFPNKQKIILSTNIAETGVTIPDVVYVIDTGLAKETSYDSINDICSLQKTLISKASADQRRGRAGRTCNGICFRLYTKACYDALVPDSIPEILRIPLYELCLQSKLLAPEGEKIADFLQMALQCPSQRSIDCAISGLIALGALDEEEEVTLLGQKLLQLSLEPRLAKMLIYSVLLKCIDPILTIVSCLSQKELFSLPTDPRDRQIATEKQRELAGDSLSDHYVLLKAFQMWQKGKTQKSFDCKNYFINNGVMELINATRSQLLSQLRAMEFVDIKNCNSGIRDLNTNSNNWAVIKAALTVGCYPNLAFMKKKDVSTRTENKVKFTSASTLIKACLPNCCVIYEELSKTGFQHIIRCGTVITPLTVAIMCGEVDKTSTGNNLRVDEWLEIENPYKQIVECRNKIHKILDNKIVRASHNFSKIETEILNYLVKILEEEDVTHNFVSPPDVGLPPKLFNSNYWSQDHHGRQASKMAQLENWREPALNFKFSNELNKNGVSKYISSNNSLPKHTAINNTDVVSLPFDIIPEARNIPREHSSHSVENMPSNSSKISTTYTHTALEKNNACSTLHNSSDDNINSASNLMSAINLNLGIKAVTQHAKCHKQSSTNWHKTLKDPENSVFFVIKPYNEKNFKIGITTDKWIFSANTQTKLIRFLVRKFDIYLFFTIHNTREFQGFAKFLGSYNGARSASEIEWLSTRPVSYDAIDAMALTNPCNNDLLLYQCQDGQEVDFYAAQQLSQMFFTSDPNMDLL